VNDTILEKVGYSCGVSLSSKELHDLRVSEESDRIERKRSLSGDALTKIREAICAFANDLPNHRQPGYVLVGINDDGSTSDVDISDERLVTLGSIKLDGKILPPPTMTVERYTDGPHAFAVIAVIPSDSTPVRLDGRVLIRVGPRRGVATI
jgi:ATP-dependent DNA helicase RecG